MPSGNKIGALATPESLPMCQLWWLLQIAEAESRSAAMWRSPDLNQEGTLPQGGSNWLAPPSDSSPGDFGWYTHHYSFCLHPRQQPPHHQRSIKLDQKHKRPDTYHGWLQWTQLRGAVLIVKPRVKSLRDSLINTDNLCILNDGTHTYLKPQAQHVNRPTAAIDLTISTPGLALRSVWEVLPDTHGSDHYPILTSILPSVAEIQPRSFPLGFFQGQLGTVSWYVFGKHLWGYTRGSRFLTLLCQAHYQGRKWLHPKGNHHPQEIKPLVW